MFQSRGAVLRLSYLSSHWLKRNKVKMLSVLRMLQQRRFVTSFYKWYQQCSLPPVTTSMKCFLLFELWLACQSLRRKLLLPHSLTALPLREVLMVSEPHWPILWSYLLASQEQKRLSSSLAFLLWGIDSGRSGILTVNGRKEMCGDTCDKAVTLRSL